MKKMTIYIIFTTGASLIILAGFFIIFDIKTIDVSTVFQALTVNIIINYGITFMHKAKMRNIILEYLLDVTYIIIVLILFRVIFKWYPSVPIWVLIVMAIAIYILVEVTSIAKIKKDTEEINELLQKRREKIENIVS